jgi:hypothetical protein
MSTTTGFDLAGISALVNETEFGNLWYKEPIMGNNTFSATDMHGQVLTGAKNDNFKLPTYSSTATLKDGSDCGFTPTDQSALEQTDLAMVTVTVQGQFCVKTLEPYWVAAGLPAGQHYTGFNPLEAQLLSSIADEIGKKMAIFPYYGPTGSDTVTYATPWVAQLETATGIIVDTGNSNDGNNTTGLDADGAYNRVEAMIALLLANSDSAAGVHRSGEYTIEMSPLDAWYYFQNMRTRFGQDTITPVQQQMNNGAFSTWIHPGTQVRCIVVNALQTQAVRNIICWRKGNKVLAFDLRSDATRLELGMDQYRQFIWWNWVCKMGAGIRSTNAKDVLYYGDAS